MSVQYVLPVGVHLDTEPSGDAAAELDEGYEVHWRDAEDPPHYFFYAQISVLRLDRILRDALALMPARCHAVLEQRRGDEAGDPSAPAQERHVSELLPRSEIAAVYARYRFQILHDGMIGFGFYDPDSPLEVFLDDHKLLSLFSGELEPFEGLLAGLRVPHRRHLETVLDLGHEHLPLAALHERTKDERHAWLARRKFEVERCALAMRRRLRMHLEPQRRDEEAADHDDE